VSSSLPIPGCRFALSVGLGLVAFRSEPKLGRPDVRGQLHGLIFRTFLNETATEKGQIG
jgi:hypothetical protein